MRRANSGTELHDHVRGIRPEPINHVPDRVRNDAELGAFAPGMHQTDSGRFRIDNVNSAAVGDVNAERDAALIRDDSVAAREFAAHRTAATALEDRDFVSVNLFRGEQWPVAYADCVANFAMRGFKPL